MVQDRGREKDHQKAPACEIVLSFFNLASVPHGALAEEPGQPLWIRFIALVTGTRDERVVYSLRKNGFASDFIPGWLSD
ncbi:MAG: hypothetical protein HY661_10410 [Betaproteobacteria bacterium]|nr:hypothetical protein [Betaproteobacteria bacterium]